MALNILQIAPQIPYPLADGGKVGIYNITKHLVLRGHNITLLAFERSERFDTTPLEKYCRLITVPHSTNNSVLGATLNLFSPLPYNISKYFSSKLTDMLKTILRQRTFDIVHVDHLHMGHYGLLCKRWTNLPIVLREHNVESVIMERFAETVSAPLTKKYLETQVHRIRRYESETTAGFDLCCVITKADEQRLLQLQPTARTRVVPGGVDPEYFRNHSPQKKIPQSIVFFGGFDWIPNQDAAGWFITDIMPRILQKVPDATCYFVGKNVPESLRKHSGNHIVFRGFVADLKREVEQYTVSIAPFRIGGGIRLKILESFAMRVPVVATSVGCEGIDVEHEKHLLIADSAEQFAEYTVSLLQDRQLGERITEEAFQLAWNSYRWESIAEQFENAYLDTIVYVRQQRSS